MGPTNVTAEVANPFDPKRKKRLSFIADSGAVYTVIPAAQLKALGIAIAGERAFFLANGQPVKRRTGEARIKLNAESATCVVPFGEKGDNALLGVTTLENLGLIFDRIRQKLMSLPMLIADVRRYFR
jgi:predicted aspartyl protease